MNRIVDAKLYDKIISLVNDNTKWHYSLMEAGFSKNDELYKILKAYAYASSESINQVANESNFLGENPAKIEDLYRANVYVRNFFNNYIKEI